MFKPMWQILLLSTLYSTLHEVSGGFEHWCSSGMTPTGNCGKNLDELLIFYCGENGFNYRDSTYSRRRRDTAREIKMELKDFTIGGEDAKKYLSKRTDFYYQGIVCECCINQCDTAELTSYCLL